MTSDHARRTLKLKAGINNYQIQINQNIYVVIKLIRRT